MAIVTRRYLFVGPPDTDLSLFVGSGAIQNASIAAGTILDIDIDDALAGATDALDEYMATKGFVFDSTAIATASSILIWGNDDLAAILDTRYLWPGFTNLIALTTSIAGFRAPRSGTMRQFRVRHNRANGNGTIISYDVLINGVAQGLGLNLATGAIGDASDLVTTYAVSAGDLLEVTATKMAPPGSGLIGAVFACEF